MRFMNPMVAGNEGNSKVYKLYGRWEWGDSWNL